MPRWIPSLLATLAVALAAPPPATAKGEHKPKARYYFEVTAIDLAEGIPQQVAARVRTQLEAELGRHDVILRQLPAGAPDPREAPKQFKRYIKKHKLRAFKVKLDVTEYSRTIEPMPDGRRGQRLQVSIALRMFGETIPDRSMAFAGAGSAAIKLDIGKKVRARDDEEAHTAAFEPAVADAVAESLRKLRLRPAKRRRKRTKR